MSFWSKVIHGLAVAGQITNVAVGAINPTMLPPKYQIPVAAGIAIIQWATSHNSANLTTKPQ